MPVTTINGIAENHKKKKKAKKCMNRVVEIMYTQILVAIFASVLFTIYRSSKIVSSSSSNQVIATDGATPPELPTSTGNAAADGYAQQKSLEAQVRQEALERLAREAAEFEDDDNTNNNNNNNNANVHVNTMNDADAMDSLEIEIPPPANDNLQQEEPADKMNNNDGEDYSGFLVQPNDFIYQKMPGEAAPIVVERFKLIFFAQAKVGCTVWKMLFRRMMGYKDWRQTTQGLPHVPDVNGLKYLYHYNISYASQILQDPTWTKAIIVRDPKERFLSAYLDKAVESQLFVDTCCNTQRKIYCNVAPPPIYEFMSAIQSCHDSHWDPQSERMEPKYWQYVNFVGHLETVQKDAKRLLKGLRVWEHFGATGWGDNNLLPIFASEDGTRHARDASSKVTEYIYKELEQEIEEYYDGDYKSPLFNFTDSKKFTSDTPRTAVDHATLGGRPLVEPRDWIYRKCPLQGEAAPIVIEKYKLVFFATPHAAENEFKRLFRRMMGLEDWKTQKYDRKNPEAINQGLVYLRDFSLTRASEIMTSPDWTRAIFVRDPKERFALAYTQTAVRKRLLLHKICCTKIPRMFCLKGTSTKDLLNVPTSTEFLKGIRTCKSTHWDPQIERLEAVTRLGGNAAQRQTYDPNQFVKGKYWKYINFVGSMDNAQKDAKALLERLGNGVWREFGESGWADAPGEVPMGHDEFFGTTSFLKQELKAKKFVQQVIKDPQMEADIEKLYDADYRSPWFDLPKKVLFASEGNTYGNVANMLLSDFKKVQQESEKAVQRQW